MFPASSTRIRLFLSKFGQECPILRKTEGEADRLNHASGSHELFGTTLAAYYRPDADAGQTSAGELDLSNTVFAVPTDTDIRQDDHLIYDKTVYEVDSVITRPHYKQVHATVTG